MLPVQFLMLLYVWLFQVIKDPPPPPPAPKEVRYDGAPLLTLGTQYHSSVLSCVLPVRLFVLAAEKERTVPWEALS